MPEGPALPSVRQMLSAGGDFIFQCGTCWISPRYSPSLPVAMLDQLLECYLAASSAPRYRYPCVMRLEEQPEGNRIGCGECLKWCAGDDPGLVAIGVDGTPRFIAAGVRTACPTAFRTCSAKGY